MPAQTKGFNGVALGIMAAGGVLVWSGLNNANIIETLRALAKGSKPEGHPKPKWRDIVAEAAGSVAGDLAASGGVGATAMITTAKSQVGTRESGNNCQKYSREIGRGCEAWCADFLVWCAKKSGNSGAVPNTASAPGMAQAFGRRFTRGSSGIQAGDIVFYASTSNGWGGIGHVGIAITANTGGTWQSVEGNHSDKVSLVTRRSCQGHARPD